MKEHPCNDCNVKENRDTICLKYGCQNPMVVDKRGVEK